MIMMHLLLILKLFFGLIFRLLIKRGPFFLGNPFMVIIVFLHRVRSVQRGQTTFFYLFFLLTLELETIFANITIFSDIILIEAITTCDNLALMISVTIDFLSIIEFIFIISYRWIFQTSLILQLQICLLIFATISTTAIIR